MSVDVVGLVDVHVLVEVFAAAPPRDSSSRLRAVRICPTRFGARRFILRSHIEFRVAPLCLEHLGSFAELHVVPHNRALLLAFSGRRLIQFVLALVCHNCSPRKVAEVPGP